MDTLDPTDPDDEADSILAAGHVRNDALEGIQAALESMVAKSSTPTPPPVVHVAAPSAPAINVNVPKPPQRWTVEITERDRDDRIRKFTMTAS